MVKTKKMMMTMTASKDYMKKMRNMQQPTALDQKMVTTTTLWDLEALLLTSTPPVFWTLSPWRTRSSSLGSSAPKSRLRQHL